MSEKDSREEERRILLEYVTLDDRTVHQGFVDHIVVDLIPCFFGTGCRSHTCSDSL
jgi:hypothetical protein